MAELFHFLCFNPPAPLLASFTHGSGFGSVSRWFQLQEVSISNRVKCTPPHQLFCPSHKKKTVQTDAPMQTCTYMHVYLFILPKQVKNCWAQIPSFAKACGWCCHQIHRMSMLMLATIQSYDWTEFEIISIITCFVFHVLSDVLHNSEAQLIARFI